MENVLKTFAKIFPFKPRKQIKSYVQAKDAQYQHTQNATHITRPNLWKN